MLGLASITKPANKAYVSVKSNVKLFVLVQLEKHNLHQLFSLSYDFSLEEEEKIQTNRLEILGA